LKVIGRFTLGRSLILLLISAAIIFATSWTGKVVGISDGDTFSVMYEGKAIKIRLHGVDCPETAQPFGTKAKQFASSLVFGQDVRVDPVERDRYGRLVATLHLQDGRVLNHELVRHGFAWWYKQYAPGDTVLPRLENEAREGRIGLWADDAPIPPWNWRKGEREKRVGEPAAPRGPPDTNAHQKPEFSQGTETTAQEIVYRTNTGKKYHRDGCRYLKSRIQTTASNASAMGLSPCSSCNPPSAAASLGQSEAPQN
jgi:micrococcal nuclease